MSDTEAEMADSRTDQPHRRRRKSRTGLVVLLGVVVVALGLPLLVLSLTGATLRAPDWLALRVEERLNDRLGSGRVTLDQIGLVIDRGMRPQLQMLNVGIFGENGGEVARLNELRARLAPMALLRGRVAMTALQISGAQITTRRRTDGTFDLSFGGGGGASGTLAGVLDALDQAFAAEPLAGLDTIGADQLTIALEDARSGRLWQVTEGRIALTQTDESLDLTVAAEVFNGTEELATMVIGFRTEKESAAASLTATFENAAAADIAAQSPALSFLKVLDAPISGALRAAIGQGGEIADLAGTLVVGEGALQPTPDTPPIEFHNGRAYVDYDPKAQTLTFTEVSVQSELATVTAGGTAILQEFRDGWPGALVGQLALSDARIQPQGVFAEPMRFESGAMDFRLRLDPFQIDIGQVALQRDEQRFNGRGRIRGGAAGWDVALDIDLNTIPLDRLLALWPVSIAPGTRDWLGQNVLTGAISGLTGALRQTTDKPLEMSVSYVFGGTDVTTLKALPPIRNASGYASLTGTTYTMVFEQGAVTAPVGGEIDVAGSVLRIADVTAKPSRAEVALRTQSSITAGLSLLDLLPIGLMKKAGLPVDVAEGRARTQAAIGFDLKREILFGDVDYQVVGELADLASDTLIKDRVVRAARLDLRADPQGVVISGPGHLGQVPLTVSWAQNFGPEHAGISRVEGSIELGQPFMDEFAIALPPGSVTGSGVGLITVDLVKGEAPRFELISDLNRLGLKLAALDWSKPRNRTGKLEVVGRMGEAPTIDRLILRAPGLSASGVVDLAPGGALESAQFDRVQVGNWLDGPVTLTGRGAGRAPAVAVNGGSIDLRTARMGAGAGETEGGPLTLKLDRLTVSEGIAMTRFHGEFKAGKGLEGQFSALVNGAAPVEGTVVPTPSGAAIRLVSERAGSVLAAAGILRNVRGGKMDLTLNPTRAKGTYEGRLDIRNARIVQAPVMTELLNAISIVGLLDQMNSGGITLSNVEAEFQLTPERLTLYHSAAVGPSLGISLDGIYNMKQGRLDMQGVISPVYFLNGLGQLFSRGREGLFGFSFRMTGAVRDPRVSINPLSILTPGAFREIFRRPPPQPSQ